MYPKVVIKDLNNRISFKDILIRLNRILFGAIRTFRNKECLIIFIVKCFHF